MRPAFSIIPTPVAQAPGGCLKFRDNVSLIDPVAAPVLLVGSKQHQSGDRLNTEYEKVLKCEGINWITSSFA